MRSILHAITLSYVLCWYANNSHMGCTHCTLVLSTVVVHACMPLLHSGYKICILHIHVPQNFWGKNSSNSTIPDPSSLWRGWPIRLIIVFIVKMDHCTWNLDVSPSDLVPSSVNYWWSNGCFSKENVRKLPSGTKLCLLQNSKLYHEVKCTSANIC